jgi:phosphoglycolate/pyridoxal phosphate phosphatase family enzyme
MKNIKAVAFDLDGTIYEGNNLLKGALETIEFLEKKNIDIFYFTNNSGKTRQAVFEKLLNLGIRTEISKVYNSAYAAAFYLKKNKYKRVYCCGTAGLKEEIIKAGIKCVDGKIEKAQAVVTGLDPDFNYIKLSGALDALTEKGCKLITCNRDKNYPAGKNKILPGCGPIIAAVECASGRQADMIAGKPGTFMVKLLCSDWKLKNRDLLIVGDTYDSDILMAKEFGAKSVFISKNMTQYKDTVTVKNISGIIKLFKKI